MRRLLAPGIDAPDISAIEDFVRAPDDGPRRLQGLITTDLPTAADWPYALVHDTTVGKPKFSDGTSWFTILDTTVSATLYQPLDATLTALAGAAWSAGTQALTLTAADTITLKTVGAASGNILDKAAGDSLYQPLDGDLTAIAALAGTSTIYYRSAANTWTAVTIGGNLGFSAGTLGSSLGTAATKATGPSGNTVPLLDGTNTWTNTQTGGGGWLSTSPTAGVGYTTGAGGTVTQLTSKSTLVALNKMSGTITTHNAALAATTTVTFAWDNSSVAANDVVILNIVSGATAGAYQVWITGNNGTGNLTIALRNITAGSLSEAVVIWFGVIKGKSS